MSALSDSIIKRLQDAQVSQSAIGILIARGYDTPAALCAVTENALWVAGIEEHSDRLKIKIAFPFSASGDLAEQAFEGSLDIQTQPGEGIYGDWDYLLNTKKA